MVPIYITKTKAIEIIAERTKPAYEHDLRAWKNKIGGRINYWLKKGKINTNSEGDLHSGHIAEMLKEAFPDCFYDWPCSFRGTPKMGSFKLTGNKPLFLPSDLAECHAIIKAMHEEIQQLKPDAQRYRDICAKNKNNGLKNRKCKDF